MPWVCSASLQRYIYSLVYNPGFTFPLLQSLALKMLPLFVTQAELDMPDAFRIRILHIIFDLLMVHERTFLAPGEDVSLFASVAKFH